MEIKPVKKVKSVKGSRISSEDLLQRPQIEAPRSLPERPDYEFVNRQLFFDGKDVGDLINETFATNPNLLSKIAGELERFKNSCAKKKKRRFFKWGKRAPREYDDDELGIIFALCDAYISKISDLIKKRYDQTKDGISLVFDEDNQLVLNGMNIHALVKQCRENPNPKSLLFLKGIRSRLDRVLENKINSRNYDRIHEVVLALFEEIDAIFKDHPLPPQQS